MRVCELRVQYSWRCTYSASKNAYPFFLNLRMAVILGVISVMAASLV